MRDRVWVVLGVAGERRYVPRTVPASVVYWNRNIFLGVKVLIIREAAGKAGKAGEVRYYHKIHDIMLTQSMYCMRSV